MSAPKEVVWPLDPHTLAKHRIIRAYLNAWLPIMMQAHGARGGKRILIIDGFAGPGEYVTGEEGTPIIAIKAYLEHRARASMKIDLICLFIEEDEERARHLEEVAIPKLEHQPKNILIHVRNASFDEAMTELLDGIQQDGKSLAPAFAIVDPFGFSATPMSVVARILGEPRSEVMVTLMARDLNRFATHPDEKVLTHYDELFGTNEWRSLQDLKQGRLEALSGFYGERLRSHARYVWSFRMTDEKNAPIYDLWYATKNIKGLEAMKRAMWSVDPVAGAKFSDRTDPDQEALFVGEGLANAQSRAQNLFVAAFRGNQVPIKTVHEWILTETPLHDGHYKSGVLKPLEEAGKIKYIPADPKKRRQMGWYPAGSAVEVMPIQPT